MIIDDITYKLDINNYVPLKTNKKRIIFGNTFNHDMKHVIGWKHRYSGKYKKTAAFTIDVAGSVYQHYDPMYTSVFFNDINLDTESIVILIENDGWLSKDAENGEFITWVGHIYKEPKGIVEKKWKEHTMWCSYSKEQFQSAQDLVRLLCDKFSIPLTAISHNTKVVDIEEYEGVIYNSNLSKKNNDLSPAWDFKEFKDKIELRPKK